MSRTSDTYINHRKRFLLLLLLLLLLAAILAAAFLRRSALAKDDPEELQRQQFFQREQSVGLAKLPAAEADFVDFPALWEKNEEIQAWLDIPGTGISYPVLQSRTDNGFYLTHNADGKKAKSGALFIEDYNSSDFSDSVNVIYGHRMRSGAFFGELQSFYEDAASFEAHRHLTLYLPDRQEDYLVIATVPFTNEHILYHYDFSQSLQHYTFFDKVFSTRQLSAHVDSEQYPQPGERILILSTCLRSDRSQRYLVIAKEVLKE